MGLGHPGMSLSPQTAGSGGTTGVLSALFCATSRGHDARGLATNFRRGGPAPKRISGSPRSATRIGR
jgi:hypothetical protein